MKNDIKITGKNFLFGLNFYFIRKSLYVRVISQSIANQKYIYFI